MPAYNHVNYIGHAIDSVLKQTFADYELIIIEDGSTDGTREVLKRYTDPRIKMVLNEQNLGLCKSFNKALAMTSGEYIAQLASDDAFHPEKLAKQVAFLDKRPDIGLVFSHCAFMDRASNIYHFEQINIAFNPGNRSYEEWLRYFFDPENHVAACSVLMRTHVLKEMGGYDERFLQSQDRYLWQKCLIASYNAHILEERLIHYRYIPGNSLNLSGSRKENVSRCITEVSTGLDCYLNLRSLEVVQKMFPDVPLKNEKLIPFYLAQQAFGISSMNDEFAIRTLFRFFEDPAMIALAEKEHGYTMKDFYAATAASALSRYSTYWKDACRPVQTAISCVLRGEYKPLQLWLQAKLGW